MTSISSNEFCHIFFYGACEFMYQLNDGVKSPNTVKISNVF